MIHAAKRRRIKSWRTVKREEEEDDDDDDGFCFRTRILKEALGDSEANAVAEAEEAEKEDFFSSFRDGCSDWKPATQRKKRAEGVCHALLHDGSRNSTIQNRNNTTLIRPSCNQDTDISHIPHTQQIGADHTEAAEERVLVLPVVQRRKRKKIPISMRLQRRKRNQKRNQKRRKSSYPYAYPYHREWKEERGRGE